MDDLGYKISNIEMGKNVEIIGLQEKLNEENDKRRKY
jgi:hypothetical protein